MKISKKPLWRKSMLSSLNLSDIKNFLYEISENGDMYGYENGEEGYYQDYKELFDDLSDGAYRLIEALQEHDINGGISEHWNDMTVALLGEIYNVTGYDTAEDDYYEILDCNEEEWARKEAVKRIERLTKREMLLTFRKVMTALVLFFDIKAAHDCLTSIVEELDERGAILQRTYERMTETGNEAEKGGAAIPQRMWVE